MPSAYERAQTNWDRAEFPTEPEVKTSAAAEGPDPNDQWATAEYLAKQAAETAEVEKNISLMFEKRSTIARRMMDGSKRRDPQMMGQAAQDWLRTEVRLHDLFRVYTQHVNRRNEVVASLPEEVRGQIMAGEGEGRSG